jgi:uncharacterized protein YndB with AHSA1/START domain
MSDVIDGLALSVERLIAAPRHDVWRALTEADLYAQWMGPAGSTTTVEALEARPGGRLAFNVRLPDGPEFSLGGTYIEVDPPRRVVHTWTMAGDESLTTVQVDLHEEGGQTRLVLTHTGFADQGDMDQNDAGWRHQLDRLEDALASDGRQGDRKGVTDDD